MSVTIKFFSPITTFLMTTLREPGPVSTVKYNEKTWPDTVQSVTNLTIIFLAIVDISRT